MKARRPSLFTTVRTEGGLLPAEFLLRVSEGDSSVPGLKPADYHLLQNEKLSEAINRSWNRLSAAWQAFKKQIAEPGVAAGHAVTRERWLLPLFQELGYGRLTPARSAEIDAKPYPISHFWNHVPVHLVGAGIEIDRRTPGVAGAARQSPNSLVQEFLNRSDQHLWAFLSNGLRLRILRDNVSLTRQAFVEFDLETMFDAEVYSDFAVLWLLCHESRVEGEPPEICWLEKWTILAQEQGTRVLDHLREGVEQAIKSLGTGFLSCPANSILCKKLKEGRLSGQNYYRQLLRLIYRLIFLFAAEDRNLLLMPDAPQRAKDIYMLYYSTSRLRRLAERHRGSRHVDLGRQLFFLFDKFDSEAACPELALPALGSFLWSKMSMPDLDGCDIENCFLLDAIRHLSFTMDGPVRRPVDYRNMGSEELGSIYESLLEFHPEINLDATTFHLTIAQGHERKSTGSYYTASPLINSLLDTALEPVINERLSRVKKGGNWEGEAEKALLSIKVCDPACGSGHFLIAAAHRLAKRLAEVRTGDEEPGPDALRLALRDVIGRCIHGVDINPMAVELCKVNLWLEALVPGRPLNFLDHHVKCGNSLVGATPALMAHGIPDDALKPVEGDDKGFCKYLRQENRKARKGERTFWAPGSNQPWVSAYGKLAQDVLTLVQVSDETIGAVHEKEALYGKMLASEPFKKEKLLADAWCASFFWKKNLKGYPPPPYPITHEVFLRLRKDPEQVQKPVKDEIERLAKRYQFFHWHLEFPEVFTLPLKGKEPDNPQTGLNGGFDVVLGNPPWERIKLQEKEFFASRNKEIANGRNTSVRKRLINALKDTDPVLLRQYLAAKRDADVLSLFIRSSMAYPLCGRGDVNTYSIFSELKRNLMGPLGRVGCIVQSGIATDDTTKFFFQSLINEEQLVSFFDFENSKGKKDKDQKRKKKGKWFPGVDSRIKFCLLTMTGKKVPANKGAEFAFFLHNPAELSHKERRFTLSAEDIALINPNTRTCPIFRSRQDAELTKAIYRRVPVLIKDGPVGNPWSISFMAMFHMSNDSRLFRTRDQLENIGYVLKGNVFARPDAEERHAEVHGTEAYLPLYEAKMVHHFNHRFGDYLDLAKGSRSTQLPEVPVERLEDPNYVPLPRYWVAKEDVEKRLKGRWAEGWLLGWRRNSRSTDERTFICSLFPGFAIGDSLFLFFLDPKYIISLYGALSGFSFDFVVRQKLGGTNNSFFVVEQLSVLPPSVYSQPCLWETKQSLAEWILPRVLELTYTAWDLKPFAEDCGYYGRPFQWDEERRFLMRCELDSAFFHLYLGTYDQWQKTGSAELLGFFPTPRDAVSYIMETFPIVKKKDEQKHGSFRTKETILQIYDKMREATDFGRSFRTLLDPPPAHSSDLCREK